ncbi:hypothetical protein G6F56_010332 [Rhizopus delemar]|nr:hypothetical protein G6F56_010332 [Rhizopus delemar]
MNTPPSAEVQGFPHNIEFKEADWTKGKVEKEKYDTILALSVTKWIQLHKGDDGLKRFFKKIYNSLKTGGTLVLEAQDFTTFQKRAKNTELNVDVEKELQFKPENYTEYLIKEVGFTSVNDLGVPKDESKGFSRPVVLYTK